MKIRSALIICGIFAMFVFVLPFGNTRTPHTVRHSNRLVGIPSGYRVPIFIPVPPTTTTTMPPAPLVVAPVPSDYAAWTHVSVCENGVPGWNPPQGSAYPDSLGIDAANWYAMGGGSDLSPAAQIAVADRLIASIGMGIPDQGYCASW